jgi:hypothetical protein
MEKIETEIYHASTEGDCEGRTTRNLGYFTGRQKDIIAYLEPEKTYDIRLSPIKVYHISEEAVQERVRLQDRLAQLKKEIQEIEEKLDNL